MNQGNHEQSGPSGLSLWFISESSICDSEESAHDCETFSPCFTFALPCMQTAERHATCTLHPAPSRSHSRDGPPQWQALGTALGIGATFSFDATACMCSSTCWWACSSCAWLSCTACKPAQHPPLQPIPLPPLPHPNALLSCQDGAGHCWMAPTVAPGP